MGYKHIPDAVINDVQKQLSKELVDQMFAAAVENQRRLKEFADDCERMDALIMERFEDEEDMINHYADHDELVGLYQKWGIPL